MSQTRTRRPPKRQLGQFMTPPSLAENLVRQLPLSADLRVLEPSFGDGSFILPLIEAFLPLYPGPVADRLDAILSRNIFGVEIDATLYQACLEKIARKWGHVPPAHNLVCADFLQHTFELPSSDPGQWNPEKIPLLFDLIIGNPPFGGTINPRLQDALDRAYGYRNGEKIKKETYSFFIVKGLDHLKTGGRLRFICSDTFLTIRTMRGLRKLLLDRGSVNVEGIAEFSAETSYPMVLLDTTRQGPSDQVTIDGKPILRGAMELTGNYSWAITDDHSKFFTGPKLGDYVICSSGMTIGKNEWFLKEVIDSQVTEAYDYKFYQEPITVAGEIQRARLHQLSPRAIEKAEKQERLGATRRRVRVTRKPVPEPVRLPHPDYRYYNKATSGIIFAKPTHAIYWKDDGDAVLTFKKSGNWYLHGVGGARYFGQSGLTWQLISSRLNVRYLPEGYILDSGAPCAFARPGVDRSELRFILGWTCTDACTRLLKTVINHTQNIQSKDFERLPYPFWVNPFEKEEAIATVSALIEQAMQGRIVQRGDAEVALLEKLYSYKESDAE
ncbi:MAG TPA: N-6 DNA methylase [Chloroflexota bacterium]|nr:N-6 DNA methylase [Chloroflexota bacterium]